MTILGDTVTTLVILALAAVAVVFVLALAWYRDGAKAAEQTTKRAGGVLVGAGGTASAAAVAGTEIVLQLPELAIAAVGIGSIIAGINWWSAAAIMLVVYVAAEAVNGGPRYS